MTDHPLSAAAPAARPRPLAAQLSAPLRQPLVQFILLGLLLSLAAHGWQALHDRHVIHLTAAVKQQIAQHYQQQFGAPPDEAQRALLLQQYLRDEIFLREALALHLDQNDEIVRRRLVQKFGFLQTESTPQPPPSEADLARWFAAHQAQYETPATVAFTQLYFSPDRGGYMVARQRALTTLAQLDSRAPGPGRGRGDPFPGPPEAGDLSPREAQRLFGDSELAQRLFDLPGYTWSGPYRSGYGWHLVYVSGHHPATTPSLADIRPRVLADYLTERRQQVAARAYDALRARYTIRETP